MYLWKEMQCDDRDFGLKVVSLCGEFLYVPKSRKFLWEKRRKWNLFLKLKGEDSCGGRNQETITCKTKRLWQEVCHSLFKDYYKNEKISVLPSREPALRSFHESEQEHRIF